MSSFLNAATATQLTQVSEASTVSEFRETLLNLPEGTVIFVDVDDTLITPCSKIFRHSSPYRFLIDEIKQERDKIENFEILISRWRLQRKIQLVTDEWPLFIHSLKKATPVYGLTKMETGPLGDIPSMEKWRHQELEGRGISFTPTFQGHEEIELSIDAARPYPAFFYKGIFMTGSFNKGEVLRAFLRSHPATQIVLIDDRIEYLRDVQDECQRQNLPFLGILFKGIELIPGEPNPKVVEVQKQYFFQQSQWLEDEEAEMLCG